MVYTVGVLQWKIHYPRHSRVQILFWKSNKDGPEKEIRQLAQMKQSTGPEINVMLGNPFLSPPCSLEKHIINSLMEAVSCPLICVQSDRRSLEAKTQWDKQEFTSRGRVTDKRLCELTAN